MRQDIGREVRLASLFSGIGGFDLAAEREGFHTVLFSEISPIASKILAFHWPHIPNLGDVRRLQGKNIDADILVAGFPCIDLSIGGKKLGLKGGENSILFFEIVRLIREMQDAGRTPRFLVLENVANLLHHNSGKDFSIVLEEIQKCGALDIAWRVLDSRYSGVPQTRRRIFIVADFRGECAGKILLDESAMHWAYQKNLPKRKLSTNNRLECFVRPDQVSVTLWPKIAQTHVARDCKGPRNEFLQNTIAIRYFYDGIEWYTLRRYTPVEVARLMGFPDTWLSSLSVTQQNILYGNSVVVPLVQEIFARIRPHLSCLSTCGQ